MFWFKRKEIVVDCFVTNPVIEKFQSIAPAYNFFPEGWKTLPKTVNIKVHENNDPNSKIEAPLSTIKKCIGIQHLFSNGFIIPAWADFHIEIQKTGKLMYASPAEFQVDQHPTFQLWDGLYDGYGHVKISSPWVIHEKSGVSFTWNQCDWHNTKNAEICKIVSGVLDFKYQHQSNINMFVKKDSVYSANAGDPLVHLIPISEKNVKIKTHLVDINEIRKLDHLPAQYSNQYNTIKRKTIEQEAKKCPFGFGK
jgi:hypothetical protein